MTLIFVVIIVHCLCVTVEGIKALYYIGYIHRNIKPDNILIRRNRFGIETAVLTDFSYAIKRNEICKSQSCGTSGYVAPEVVFSRKSSEKMDIYSLGITLIQMIYGSVPSIDCPECKGLAFVTLPNKLRAEITNSCWNCIQRMTMKDPVKRVSYEELWKDPWLCATSEELRDAYYLDRMTCLDMEYTYSGKDGEEAMEDLKRVIELKRDINWPIDVSQDMRRDELEELSVMVNWKNRGDFVHEVILTRALSFAREGAICESFFPSCAIAKYKIATIYMWIFNVYCHTGSSHLVRAFSARISMLESREMMKEEGSSSEQ